MKKDKTKAQYKYWKNRLQSVPVHSKEFKIARRWFKYWESKYRNTQSVWVQTVPINKLDKFDWMHEKRQRTPQEFEREYLCSPIPSDEESLIKTESAINDLGAAGIASAGYLIEFTKRLGTKK